jgi:RHS repeat-associated protein
MPFSMFSFQGTPPGSLTGSSDSALNQASSYSYDEFNRLTSRTVNSGTVANYTYVYDRYGNRWQQNVTSGSGPQPQNSFNSTNNQITSGGAAYDAVGNLTNDGSHSYTYDAEGNITKVDGGATATYTYDALNHRVRTAVGSTAIELIFNASGQRVSTWNGTTRVQLQGQYYWGAKPVAFYTTVNQGSAAAHFQHQDWQGTERMRTAFNGNVEGSYSSLPFGDGQASTGADSDPYHYATLDHDPESDTEHAQFRQYSNTQGRWLRPDPYYGSYDSTNPQSFNRYAYVLNNPLSRIDPSGQDDCSFLDDEVSGAPITFYGTCEGGEGGSTEENSAEGNSNNDLSGDPPPIPPGTIVEDQHGNLYIVGPDGELYSVSQSVTVSDCKATEGCSTVSSVSVTQNSNIPHNALPVAPSSQGQSNAKRHSACINSIVATGVGVAGTALEGTVVVIAAPELLTAAAGEEGLAAVIGYSHLAALGTLLAAPLVLTVHGISGIIANCGSE